MKDLMKGRISIIIAIIAIIFSFSFIGEKSIGNIFFSALGIQISVTMV